MSWITIPNEAVSAFSGHPLRSQRMNQDLDVLYREFRCPSPECPEKFVLIDRWQEHAKETHEDHESLRLTASPEMEDRTTARVILDILSNFQRPDPNLLRRLQKANDGFHATETWRRAWLAWTRNDPEIRLKKEQYDWLHQLLDRKVPLAGNPQEAKQRKEEGEEPQTIASHLFSLSEDNVRQALTTLPDRRRPEPDPDNIPLDDRVPAR